MFTLDKRNPLPYVRLAAETLIVSTGAGAYIGARIGGFEGAKIGAVTGLIVGTAVLVYCANAEENAYRDFVLFPLRSSEEIA